MRPQAFKSLVGKGHSEFSSGRQQVGGERRGRGLSLDSGPMLIVALRWRLVPWLSALFPAYSLVAPH